MNFINTGAKEAKQTNKQKKQKQKNKTLADGIQQYIKRTVYHDQAKFISGMQSQFKVQKPINIINYNDVEKIFDEI